MGIYDRPYMHDGSGGPGGPHLRLTMPKPGKAIKYLLIINIAVFVVQIFLDRPTLSKPAGQLSSIFGVTVGAFWQPWRYITFQFLHSTDRIWHIGLNMLGLYMLGTPLEQTWGTRRFLRFYLSCGIAAGVAYVIIGALYGLNPSKPIIGASGGVYGIVLACAVLFPQFRLIFLFFPVPIRLAALIIFGGMSFLVLQSLVGGDVEAAMSDVAHLGGAVAAGVWIWFIPRLRGARRSVEGRLNRGAWERKMNRRQAEQAEIDRILRKIHEAGLNSLTDKERKILQNATHHQREEDRGLYRL